MSMYDRILIFLKFYCGRFKINSKVGRKMKFMYQLLFSHSGVSDSCDLMDCRHPALLSMGFPRQEHWGGLPVPFPGDLWIFIT